MLNIVMQERLQELCHTKLSLRIDLSALCFATMGCIEVNYLELNYYSNVFNHFKFTFNVLFIVLLLFYY